MSEMSESHWSVARKLLSKPGQKQVWGIYRLELDTDLTKVLWKGLDAIEYQTEDKSGEPTTAFIEVQDAMDLLANLKAVLEVTR